MPVSWNDRDFERFFGVAPTTVETGEFAGRVYTVSFVGKRLNYELIIDVASDIVSIGGGPEAPFGADSLFEITVPCDAITAIADGYHEGQSGLAFWYGDPERMQNCTMRLLKRPDGDLKVWPACVFPARHPIFKELWGYNKPPLAYEPRSV